METLSDKITYEYEDETFPEDSSIQTGDVKEFIKKLKELGDQAHKMIDELAGDKLI